MSYIEKSIIDNEQVVRVFVFHRIVNAIIAVHFIISILTLGVWLLIAIPTWLRFKFTEQGLTTHRVIKKRGMISMHTSELKLPAVESVYINQGVLAGLLGFGTVTITGRGIADIKMTWVNDPMEVKKAIENAIELSASVTK